MRVFGAGVADALGFLTIVPVRGRRGFGTPFFPLVGLMIGVGVAAPLLLPLPAAAGGALALLLWTVVTGGFHEDAWADCMDAAFAPVSRERRRSILKDPRVGAHGVTGTVLLLVGRFAALVAVPPVAAVAAPVVGRWAMVLAPAWFPPRSRHGLGAAFAREARPAKASVGAVLGLSLLMLAGGVAGGPVGAALALRLAAATAAGLAAGRLLGAFFSRRFGGLNGDGYGAVGAGAEVAALWVFLPWDAAP